MQNRMDISVLIVCYRSRELIKQCLRGLFDHTIGCSYEVLLLDCSGDGAVDLVSDAFPQVRIIPNDENLGFARANNLLAEHARGAYLLLLNPDTIVTDNAIGELHQTAVAHPDAGAIGGRTRRPDGSRDPGCRQVFPTLGRLAVAAFGGARILDGALPEDATEPSSVETLSGAFMMVRTDVWREMDGFDTGYFMYAEELDLCYRLRRAGYPIIMTPAAEIVHLVGSGDARSPARVLMITRARMHFCRKFWSRPRAVAGGTLLWTHALVRYIAAVAARGVLRRPNLESLQRAYEGVAWRPGRWWHGFADGDPRSAIPRDSSLSQSRSDDAFRSTPARTS